MATGRTIYLDPDTKILITVSPVHETGEAGTVDPAGLTITSTGPSGETAVSDSTFYIDAGTNPGTSTLYEIEAVCTFPIAGAATITEFIQLHVTGNTIVDNLSFASMTLAAPEPA